MTIINLEVYGDDDNGKNSGTLEISQSIVDFISEKFPGVDISKTEEKDEGIFVVYSTEIVFEVAQAGKGEK